MVSPRRAGPALAAHNRRSRQGIGTGVRGSGKAAGKNLLPVGGSWLSGFARMCGFVSHLIGSMTEIVAPLPRSLRASI